jgi:DNA-binding NarL/FixJ family response regulator
MVKIIIADDHKIFREGVRELVSSLSRYEVIAEASNGMELMELLADRLPDIVLLDIFMPQMDGYQAAEMIRMKYPTIKVLVLSIFGDEGSYAKMMQAKVKGYVLKESCDEELEIALDEVSQNRTYFSKELLRRVVFKGTKES